LIFQKIHIGIDFDHTIVDYNGIFAEKAEYLGFIDNKRELSKNEVKYLLKNSIDGDRKWGILQSEVYSEGICKALPMDGFFNFVKICRVKQIPLTIISHKNKSNPFDLKNRNLQKPALDWMSKHGFFNDLILDFHLDQVFFADTVEEKVKKIKSVNCSHFIDDLMTVLSHPYFPERTCKILYQKNRSLERDNAVLDYSGNWYKITNYLIQEEFNER